MRTIGKVRTSRAGYPNKQTGLIIKSQKEILPV